MHFNLFHNQISIYIFDITADIKNNFAYYEYLSLSEIERATRFKFEKDRNRFIISRSVLRKIIGELISLNPKLIKILTNEFGKPFLEGTEYSNLKFNLSHSGDLIVYAFCLETDVGIDIEHIDYSINYIELAKSFFSADEISFSLNSVYEKKNIENFYSIWTRKEAMLKSLGTGLLHDLKTIDVLNNKIELLSNEIRQSNNKTVYISELSIHNDYKTSIASFEVVNPIQIQKIEF